MKEDLFDRFLTFLSKIVCPKQKPVLTDSSTTQEFIESKNTIVLYDETEIEAPGTTLVEMDNLGIKLTDEDDSKRAKFDEAKFNESTFE